MRSRQSIVSRIAREPLVHFLLIGGVLFGVYGATAEPEATSPDNRIVMTAGDIERLETLWQKRWQRPPTEAEVAGLINEQIREEVLYREALALGLDRDDTVIRRLLRQKFEFVTQDLAASREPSAEELAGWFEANREQYRTPPRLSFTQVYFDLDRRGAAGEQAARVVLASLRAGDAGPDGLGDGRLLDRTYRGSTAQEVALLFGQDFVNALMRLEPGVWSGPIASGYGLHLVRLEGRQVGVTPPLAEIEAKVRADWVHAQRQEANEAIYRQLLARYEVVIEEETDAIPAGLAMGRGRP